MNILAAIKEAVAQATGVAEIEVAPSPKAEFGDYSTPVALSLAKAQGRNPLEVAEEIKGKIVSPALVSEVTVTPPGFINFKLDYAKLAEKIIESDFAPKADETMKISIEHTSVNPNKAAHVGHLRNAVLGDTLARVLKGLGHTVEVQNYIDDLGLQVADSVLAYETFGDAPEDYEIDQWFWKIYAEINQKLENNAELQARREAILAEMEKGESETAKQIVKWIVAKHLETFGKFGIKYDILVYEHDIVENHLWDHIFEELKSKKLIINPTEGPHAGAWVVEFGESEREDKILVRSNGLLTYTAKDLAYALWKFGKTAEMPAYSTRLLPIDAHINVIDDRQSYPQAVIKSVMARLGYEKESENYHHMAYGVVKLSEKAMERLGETTGKTTSMSGRSGIGIMVDDLVRTAITEQMKEHDTAKETAEMIALASIRYYMLRTRPEREIIFDFDEALRSDGNTGVYLQYAYARACNILAKAEGVEKVGTYELNDYEKQLLKLLSEAEITLSKVEFERDPSLLADYAYSLANSFAKFYETTPVLKAEDSRGFRIALVTKYRDYLGAILDLLGIPTLSKI